MDKSFKLKQITKSDDAHLHELAQMLNIEEKRNILLVVLATLIARDLAVPEDIATFKKLAAEL